MDSRRHRRVGLHLPVRLRWSAPLGQEIEFAKTIDVSRGGLLVTTKGAHTPGVQVCITFPYDASLSEGQPEIRARVARCSARLEETGIRSAGEKTKQAGASEQERSAKSKQTARDIGDADASPTFAVAFQFEVQAHIASNGNANRRVPERRGSMRKVLGIPARVHPEKIPWFEEVMTLDISANGLRFRSQREYEPGEHLKIEFEDAASAPWHGARGFLSEVVRVGRVPGTAALEISVRRMD